MDRHCPIRLNTGFWNAFQSIFEINLIIWALLGGAGFLLGSSVSYAQDPYRMLDTRIPFRGSETQSAVLSQVSTIRIGLFAPEKDTHPAARSLIQGVSLALDQANRQGGYQGTPFELVRRWADNPWGAGSKEMIRLIYEDRVWIVIGSITGDSTHIAQQIVAKAFAPLISPIVSDPSLTHIHLPWIFRLPPDDRSQAELLIGEGVLGEHLSHIGLLTSTDHDARYAAEELRIVMEKMGVSPAFHLTISPDTDPLEDVVVRILSFHPDGLVLHFPLKRLSRFLTVMRETGADFPVFLPWICGMNAEYLSSLYPHKLVVVEPFEILKRCGTYLKFSRDYIHGYGERPDACAAYAYDAGMLAVNAIRSTGLKRTELAHALTQLRGFVGASGIVTWDNGGGNIAKPVLRVFPQR